MRKADELAEALVSFYQGAYDDGLAGKDRGPWEHFGEESLAELRKIVGGEPSPDLVRVIRDWGDECRAAWEKGREAGKHHVKRKG